MSRILFISYVSNQHSGVGNRVYYLSRELAKKGHEIHVITKYKYLGTSSVDVPIYSTDVLRKLGRYPFIWAMFLYFDDNILGIKLWNIGYTSKCITYITPKHLGRGTFQTVAGKYADII
jgi:glycosyltransferase involved in cell wall biosynthesis